jgi:hypothetical protein
MHINKPISRHGKLDFKKYAPGVKGVTNKNK